MIKNKYGVDVTYPYRRDSVNYDNLKIEDTFESDLHLLRDALRSELSAINLYNKMAIGARTEKVKAYLNRFIVEEKQHVAAISRLIMEIDRDQKDKFDNDDYCNAIYDGQCVI